MKFVHRVTQVRRSETKSKIPSPFVEILRLRRTSLSITIWEIRRPSVRFVQISSRFSKRDNIRVPFFVNTTTSSKRTPPMPG